MTKQLEIRTLGGLDVRCNGETIKFTTQKEAALLVYLAREKGMHQRKPLAKTFWEWSDQSQKNLGVAISNLRKIVGEFLEAPHRGPVSMHPDADWWLDAAELDALLNVPGEIDPDVATQVFDLYQGDFLDGFHIDDCAEFELWALTERKNLSRRTTKALDGLIGLYLNQGDYTNGIAVAMKSIRIDRLREKTYQQLMRLLALSDQRESALAQYEICCQNLRNEWKDVVPTAETTDLYEQIRDGRLVAKSIIYSESVEPVPPARHNLPFQSTSFVGREVEMADLRELLDAPDHRLLTLTGPGGIGKSRLALAAAEQALEHFTDGVFFVDLASLSSSLGIPTALAASVGFRARTGAENPDQQLLDYLREKQVLIVFDNFEHLLDGVEFVDELLATTDHVKILVTSRIQLNLGWEWVFEVEGLPVPEHEHISDVQSYGGIRLFVERARRVQRAFRLADKVSDVVRICNQVDGLPLGIELAATSLRMMPCHEIADELLGLEATQPGVPDRHRSLRTMLNHTWNHLSSQEQEAFMKLAVFRGRFTRKAAEAVADVGLPMLAALVDKSLLRMDYYSGRYMQHQLLLQFAEEKLASNPEIKPVVQDRHSAYYAEFLSEREDQLKGGRQIEALAEIETELDNVRSAWRYAITHLKMEHIEQSYTCLRLFFQMKERYQDGEAIFREALIGLSNEPNQYDRNGPLEFKGVDEVYELGLYGRSRVLLIEYATFLLGMGYLSQAGTIVGVLTDSFSLASYNAIILLGQLAYIMGDYREAEELLETSQVHIRDRWDRAGFLYHFGRLALAQGQYAEAEQRFQDSLTIRREIDDRWGMAWTLGRMAELAHIRGNIAEADRRFEESLGFFEEFLGSEGLRNYTPVLRLTFRFGFEEVLESSDISVYPGNSDEGFSKKTDYTKARQLIQATAGVVGHETRRWISDCRGNMALGVLLIEEGNYCEALRALCHGLGHLTIFPNLLPPETLRVFVKCGELFTKTRKNELGVSILIVARNHPASDQETRDQANHLLTGLEQTLPGEVFASAVEQGQTLGLKEALTLIMKERGRLDATSIRD